MKFFWFTILTLLTFSFIAGQETPAPSEPVITLDGLAKKLDSLANKVKSNTELLPGIKEPQETKQEAKKETSKEKNEPVANEVRDKVGGTIDTVSEVVSLSRIIATITLLFLIWLHVVAVNLLFEYAVKRFNRYRLRIRRLQPVVRIIIWSVGLYALVFNVFRPSTDALFALVASSAVALGFALQDVVKNVFGGLLIIFDRPFQIGDKIEIRGEYGEVETIGLRLTTIRTLDDSVVTVPNAVFISESVSNANSGALDCMVVADLWLPSQIDVDRVRQIAYEAATTSRYVNFDRPVQILFLDHFDQQAATNVKIKAYTLDTRFEKALEADITWSAKKAFAEAGIYNGKE